MFNTTLGEKMVQHLRKWLDPESLVKAGSLAAANAAAGSVNTVGSVNVAAVWDRWRITCASGWIWSFWWNVRSLAAANTAAGSVICVKCGSIPANDMSLPSFLPAAAAAAAGQVPPPIPANAFSWRPGEEVQVAAQVRYGAGIWLDMVCNSL